MTEATIVQLYTLIRTHNALPVIGNQSLHSDVGTPDMRLKHPYGTRLPRRFKLIGRPAKTGKGIKQL